MPKEDNVEHETCPLCHEKKLILTERETEVPYFGKVYLFSMTCENCKYHKADVESIEQKEPVKYEFEISKEEEMKEDEENKKKAKNLLKKILNITWGKEKQKIIIEDPSGNSAIISDKAVKSSLKVKVEK